MNAALLFVPLTFASPKLLAPAPPDLDGDLHLLRPAHDRDGDGRAGQRLGDAVAQVARGADEVVAELDDDVALAEPRHFGRAVLFEVAQLGAVDVHARHQDALEVVPVELEVPGAARPLVEEPAARRVLLAARRQLGAAGHVVAYEIDIDRL